ncbi:MAG: hypothetical protein ACHQJ6_06880 [Candidatus Berkiellales bacterium]
MQSVTNLPADSITLPQHAYYGVSYTFQTSDPELNTILMNAQQVSPLVRQALWQEQQYHQQIKIEQQALLDQNVLLWSLQRNDPNVMTFQAKTLDRIDRDIHLVEKFNSAVAKLPNAGEDGFTWSLATNKMHNILSESKKLLADETIFTDLLQGELPKDFSHNPFAPVILGDTKSIDGNSKSTYLNAALLEINLSLLGENSKIQDVQPFPTESFWLDHSAIAHMTPIPDFILPNEIAANFTSDFSFYFSDPITPQGFTFVHSGYAFGGQRDENRYLGEKPFGPEDCSSWIAKLVQADVSFSTIDQLYTYRMSLPETQRGYIEPNWLTSDYVKTMNVLTPVKVADPFTDIHPGQVMAYRDFDSSDHLNAIGGHGHTALVLGVRDNGNIVTLGYSRDMPNIEGFGIKEFHWASTDKTEMMFFNVKPTALSIDDVLVDRASDFLADQSPAGAASPSPFLLTLANYVPPQCVIRLPFEHEQHYDCPL